MLMQLLIPQAPPLQLWLEVLMATSLGQQHFSVCSLIADATAIPWVLQLVLEENH